jgi:hypothetical protein
MDNRLLEIIDKIESLNRELQKEYEKQAKNYGFIINRKKIEFLEAFREKNLKLRIPTWKYVIHKNFRHFLSMPFIYVMFIPLLILDICVTIYQLVAFSLYRIPKVKRADYIVFDRQFLDYLNIIQKINCIYCSYANGLLAYAVEIAARTERYWCPVKAARSPLVTHVWYKDFADYGNASEWAAKFNEIKAFANVIEADKNSDDMINPADCPRHV